MKSGLPSAILTTASAPSGVAEPADGELARIRLVERPQRECSCSSDRRPPHAVARVEELRPRERHEQQRQPVRPDGERVDQIEEVRAGPVDVLEDEDGRPLARRGLQENARRGEERVAIGRRSPPPSTPTIAPRCSATVSASASTVEERLRLARSLRRRRPASRSRRSRRAHDVARERAVDTALAVRQRPARDDARAGLARDSAKSAATVDLPTPAGPKIETRCGSRSHGTRSQIAPRSLSSARGRPGGDREPRSPAGVVAARDPRLDRLAPCPSRRSARSPRSRSRRASRGRSSRRRRCRSRAPATAAATRC